MQLTDEPTSSDERAVLGYLKRYIRGLEVRQLKRFLLFTTASDLMVCENLNIKFVKVEGLGRRPIAHTCGLCLELPTTYESFPELREEFSSILSLSTWEMVFQLFRNITLYTLLVNTVVSYTER